MVNNMNKNNKNRPKIALALGSGGARGLAHLGVLRAFEEEKIKIDIITGTSIGAIIGSMYTAGISIDSMEKFANSLKKTRLFDYSLPIKGGFVRGSRIYKLLQNFFIRQNAALVFEKTKIPFGCVAIDLIEGKPVYLKKGRLLPSVRASYSICGVFRPVKKGEMLLVDGGPLCRVPVRLAREMGADIVIGVDCAGPTVPIKPDNVNKWTKNITRIFLMLEYSASKQEINESDFLISLEQSDIDPLNLKQGFLAIERGYKAGKNLIREIRKKYNI